MKIRELVAAIGFDIDYDALRKLSGELDAVKSLTRETFNGLSDIARGVRNVGLGLTAGITAPMAALGTVSVMTASQVEQVLTRYKVLLGDAQKAKMLFHDLKVFDRKTPFNLEQSLQYADKLIMMKVPHDQITKRLFMLGEAAAGKPEAMYTLVEQLFQIYNKKTGDITDFRPMSNAGIPIYEALQKITGETKASGATYEQVLQALELIAKDRKGLMSEQATTLAGLWSSLQGVVFTAKSEIGNLIVEEFHLKEVTKKLIDVIEVLVEKFKAMPGWLKKILLILAGIVALIGPFMVLVGQLGLMAISIAGLPLAFSLLGISVAGVMGLIGGFLLICAKVVLIVGAIALVVEDFYRWIKGDKSLIGDLLGPWTVWYENVKQFIADIWAKMSALGSVLINPFSIGNWKNLGQEMKHMVKTAGYLTGLEDYTNAAFHGWDSGAWTSNKALTRPVASGKSIINQNQITNQLTVHVPAGTTEQQIRIINDAVDQNIQEKLNSLFVGNDG